jgi:hypothetical protein
VLSALPWRLDSQTQCKSYPVLCMVYCLQNLFVQTGGSSSNAMLCWACCAICVAFASKQPEATLMASHAAYISQLQVLVCTLWAQASSTLFDASFAWVGKSKMTYFFALTICKLSANKCTEQKVHCIHKAVSPFESPSQHSIRHCNTL